MEPIRMTIAAAVTLYNVINTIMTEKLEDGSEKEREFPFDVKYKLERAKTLFTPDFESFNKKRVELIRELGVENTEKNIVEITEDNIDTFRNRLLEFASTEVEHSAVKLSIDDMCLIKAPGVSSTEMELFMAVMVDDPEFRKSIEVETPTEIETVSNEDK